MPVQQINDRAFVRGIQFNEAFEKVEGDFEYFDQVKLDTDKKIANVAGETVLLTTAQARMERENGVRFESHASQLTAHGVSIADTSKGLQSVATIVEGNTKTLNAHDGKFEAVGNQTAVLRDRCSKLEKIVVKQQNALDALNGGSDAQKMFEKSYNDSNRVWNKIANIESSALKVLAYIGYVLASILTLGILPAVDFTSKSFTPAMAKQFANKEKFINSIENSKRTITTEAQARMNKFDELNGNIAQKMMGQTAQENLEKLEKDPKATKEAIAQAQEAVKKEIAQVDADLAAHKAEIEAEMKGKLQDIADRKKAKAEKAKVRDEAHAKLKEAADKRKAGVKAGEARLAVAREAAAKAKAAEAKAAAPVVAPAAQAPAAPVVEKPKV